MSFIFNEISSIGESIEKTKKETLNYLRKLSNLKDLPPTLRSQLASQAKTLSKDIHGIHKNSATKFHCKKCNLILDNKVIIVKIRKHNKKRKLCEMKCKGCDTTFWCNIMNKSKNKKLPETKLDKEKDKKNIVIEFNKNQKIVKPKIDVKPKKKLSKLQMMLQQQLELDKSSQMSTFFDSFAL